ncbi:MAG TPA: YihA family ribosome biogenesis GTP-binding protein [Gammaproteobacteria bacterium]|nr:YihA family ribosome biogenesis GTP-binding protein [Gammaproteobacteria bacterium]
MQAVILNFENIKFIKSASLVSQFPEDSGSEIAFVGRSNAGKSTALNAIFGRKNIAKTSKTPGRTQLINFFDVDDDCRVVDLPGYGFAAVSKEKRKQWDELISNYFRTRDALKGVFLIVDSRRMITELDRLFIDFYLPFDKSLHVILTKSDKLKKLGQIEALRSTQTSLGKVATIQLFSGTKKDGVAIAKQRLCEIFEC